jgi:predicted AAA+ superfamily ATPase
LLKQIAADLVECGAAKDDITIISFETYENRALLDCEALHKFIQERIKRKAKAYVLLDEIQLVKGFEGVVNSLQANGQASVFITGSNSKILSGELATLLGGRTLSFQVMPFNFREYKQFIAMRDLDMTPDDQTLLQSYLIWGGMPLACAERTDESRMVVLDNLYNSIVLRDIIMHNKISSPAILENILDYLIANSSTTVSGNNIAASLTTNNLKVSSPTVYDYIRAIEEAFIVSKAKRYDIRGRKMLAFESKAYVCDLGFFHLKKNRVKDEFNYLVETAIYNELLSRGHEVFIGKTYKGEVDFVVRDGEKRCYIQASYLLSSEEVVEREFGAYNCIDDSYPKYVISMDPLTMNRNGIQHLSLLDFLSDRSKLHFG